MYCDNKEVIDKATNVEPILNISETKKTEYDLWQLLHLIRKNMSLKIEFEWIKWHQDRNKEGKQIYGPFSRPVQLNILMDMYESKGAGLFPNQIMVRHVFSTTKIGFFNSNGINRIYENTPQTFLMDQS